MRSQITHTHRSHVFPEMTDNSNHEEYYNSCFFKPSEIVYSESLHQGEWVKLLNRIHSDWLNWSKAKTDLQDLRDSGHWASKSKTASTENAQTTILMGNNNLAWPKANTEMYNNQSSRPKSSQHPLFKTWDHWSETPAYYRTNIHFKIKPSTLNLYLPISYYIYLSKMIWDDSQTYIKCIHLIVSI